MHKMSVLFFIVGVSLGLVCGAIARWFGNNALGAVLIVVLLALFSFMVVCAVMDARAQLRKEMEG